MPRYFFNVYHDRAELDEEGEELPDVQAAWHEATVTAGQIIQDLDGNLAPGPGLATGSNRRIRKSAVRHSRQRQSSSCEPRGPDQRSVSWDRRPICRTIIGLFGGTQTRRREPAVNDGRGFVCNRHLHETLSLTSRRQASAFSRA